MSFCSLRVADGYVARLRKSGSVARWPWRATAPRDADLLGDKEGKKGGRRRAGHASAAGVVCAFGGKWKGRTKAKESAVLCCVRVRSVEDSEGGVVGG